MSQAKTQTAATKGKISQVVIKRMVDEDPDASYLEQEGMGFEDRLRQYREGQFCFVGVMARAEIILPTYKGYSGIAQSITSGGLWGIESDSDAAHFAEIEKEQLDELADQLHHVGFSRRAIAASFRNIEREEN